MNTIKLNNSTYQVESYNKNTYFNGTDINTNASCTVTLTNADSIDTIVDDDIDTIQIYHDDTLIYNLQDAGAHITDCNEYLSEDRMRANINFRFGAYTSPETI